MTRSRVRGTSHAALLAGFVAATGAPFAFAHHGEGPATNGKQPIVWQGTITRVSWDGPHVMYLIDVPGATSVASWQVLGGSPWRLRSRGISQRTVKAGEAVTVAGYLNPLNKIITPVYLAPIGGPKFYVGYVDADDTFRSQIARPGTD